MTCFVITALATPFKEGKLDEEGLDSLLAKQKEGGITTLAICGTTGEGPTLSLEEKKKIIKATRKSSLSMMVACGTPSTYTTCEMAKMAEAEGASSLLVIVPYFNKPTQEGIFRHFEEVAKSVSIPIYVYSHPGRAATFLDIATLKKIATIPNIVGVKEASGNLAYAEKIVAEIDDFILLSGDDASTFSIMALGGLGVISVASNIFPQKMKKLVESAFQGDFLEARKAHFELLPLFSALNLETNPIPLKAALSFLKCPGGDPRLPLTPMSKEKQEILFTALKKLCAKLCV